MVYDWIAGNWKQLINPMQERWRKLTRNDLIVAGGERERLVDLIREHYGHPRARAEMDLDEFARSQRAEAKTEVYECSPS